MKKAFLMVLLVLAVPALAFSANVVYVQSLKAKVMSAPSFKAEAVGVVKKGDALTVLHKKDRWYRVDYMNKTGWIPDMVVGTRPPMKRISVLTGEEESIGTGARRRASQVTSAAAARGLAEDDRRRLGHKGVVDYTALEKLDGLRITDEEVAQFQRELK